jgi:hypothetical protein
MKSYNIKYNGEFIGGRDSKVIYSYAMILVQENRTSVSSLHKTQKAAEKAANECNDLVATSTYHANYWKNGKFAVIEITPDMVSEY